MNYRNYEEDIEILDEFRIIDHFRKMIYMNGNWILFIYRKIFY